MVVRRGERRGGGCGGWLAGGADCETGISGTAAVSYNIWIRSVSSASRDYWRYWGIFPFNAEAKFLAAEITVYAGVTAGFEIYLRLWITVSDTHVERVCCIQIFQSR